MKILVLNGSGKGNKSNTIHYIKYIEKKFPDHKFDFINMAQKINKLDREPEAFNTVIEKMKEADGIIWSHPVYFYMVPAQVKRFMELIFERVEKDTFKGKYATAVTTSANFFDNTAHNYIQAVCEDMGMRYIEGTSWEMNDLLNEEKRKDLAGFGGHFFSAIENKILTERKFSPLTWNPITYNGNGVSDVHKRGDKKIILFTDATEKDTNLRNMINVFCKLISHPVEIINLNEVNFKGYCIGCIHCMTEGTCVHKDDFEKIFDDKMMTSDAVLYGVTIKDRYMSSKIKNFFDRHFVKGHRPVLHSKYCGSIISGPLGKLHTLREILDSMAQIGQMVNAGYVTDEHSNEDTVTEQIKAFVWKLEEMIENKWKRPDNFLGIGGHKIFRDMIYEKQHIPPFKLDHDYYKKHGLYDFPKPQSLNILKAVSAKMKGLDPKDEMLRSFQDIIEKE